MSTQPIVIQIVDKIDPTIGAKIKGIGDNARAAAADVQSLQAAVASLSSSSGLNGLVSSLAKITPTSIASGQGVQTLARSLGTLPTVAVPAAQTVTALGAALATTPKAIQSTVPAMIQLASGLGNTTKAYQAMVNAAGGGGPAITGITARIAGLVSRVTGAELGIGRLGGAFGALLTALGPVGLAIIGIAAILGTTFFLYEKWRKEEDALIETQTKLGKQFGSINDRLLEQKETLTGLTSGPLAKYAQALHDLPLKTIDVDFSNLTKELDDQHSYWQKINSELERYEALIIKADSFGLIKPSNTQSFPDIKDTTRFLNEQQRDLSQGKVNFKASKDDLAEFVAASKTADETITKNRKEALESQMIAIRNQISVEERLRADQTGAQKNITEVNLHTLHQAYDLDLLAYREYLNKKQIAGAEYNKQAVTDQLKAFTEEMERFKASVPNGITTAQDELRLRQQQLAGAARPTAIPGLDSKAALSGPGGGNVQKLTDDINKLTAEINKQGFQVDLLVKKYQDSILRAGAYSDALKAEAEFEQLVTAVESKRIPVTDELAKRLHNIAEQGVVEAKINREKVAIYNEFKGPIEQYNTSLQATTQLLRENAISADQAAVANAKAKRAMQDSIDPLNEYRISLQHEIDLIGTYGQAATIANEVDRVRQDLQRKGYDLDQKSIDSLTKLLTLLEQQKAVQQEETQLWEQNAGARQHLIEQQLGLNKAYADGVINLAQWRNGALDAALATNHLNNAITGGTLKSNIVEIYGGLINQLKGAHPIINALRTDFGQFFGSLKKGFADAVAQVLVFGGSMKDALLNMARNAVAQLISSLIELGIQFLIVTALEKLFNIHLPSKDDNSVAKQAAQMAMALASIAVITTAQLTALNVLMGPAWALAEAISLASFGANAAPASAGIAAVIAAGAVAQTAGSFAEGGLIQGKGTGTSDSILAQVSNGEFVVNAKATSKNRDVLEAINRNEDVVSFKSWVKQKFAVGGLVAASALPAFATGGYVSAPLVSPMINTSLQMKVNVVHDGSTGIQVQQIDENTVRIIARQEAKNGVREHAPSVIANELYNPNSSTSKAVTRNTDARRKR